MKHPLPTALQPSTRAKRRTPPLLAIVIALAVFLGPLLALNDPLGDALAPLDFDGIPTLDTAPRLAAFLAIIVTAALGLLWLWLRLFEQRPLWTVGFFGSHPATKVTAGFVLAVALNLAPLVIARIGGWGATPAKDLPAWPILVGGLAIMAVAWTVQSSTEEVVYRGFLTQALGLRWPLAAAVALQALVFALSHFLVNQQPAEFLSQFLIGLFFAGYVLYEGDLWGACAFHGAWNWCDSVAAVWFTGVSDTVDIVRDLLIPFAAALTVFALIHRRGLPRSSEVPSGSQTG